MTDITCTYTGDRDAALVAHVYDETDAAERAAFDAHLQTCAHCRTELAALGGVRRQLARWNPPEPNLQSEFRNPRSAIRNDIRWWQAIPAWAQAAAALLVLGASAGVANLDVHYDQSGLSVRTGWMGPPTKGAPSRDAAPDARVSSTVSLQSGASAAAPWSNDLAALEQQLRSEIRSRQPGSATQARSVSDADVKRRIEESEKRQQRELALRVAEMMRDVGAQRQADLTKIDRNLGLISNSTGIVELRQREMQSYLQRVSQKVPQQ